MTNCLSHSMFKASTLVVVICWMTMWTTPYVGWSQVTYKQMPADAGEVVQQPPTRAGACAPATALRDLEWNNVRALIETGGTLWHERANWRGAYIVPKEDNAVSYTHLTLPTIHRV